MALVDNAWYVNFGNGTSTGYYAVPQFAAAHTYAAGDLIRQLTTPAVNSERVFVCIVAGLSVAEPSWVITRGAKNTSTTPVFQECTGIAALNGDATNTPSWTISATPPGGVKNTVVTLGQVIKRDNGASYQICSTGGTAGNGAEPAFSDTAGVTTADNTVTWTSLGVVGNFTGGQAPHARLNPACASTWSQAGNYIYIHSAHAETQSTTISIAGQGTVILPNIILCHNGAAYPPLTGNITTGASITSTSNVALSMTNVGAYVEGVAFTLNGGSAGAIFLGSNSASRHKYRNCSFTLGGSATASVSVGANAGAVNPTTIEWDNVTVVFGNIAQRIGARDCIFLWQNTATAISGTQPTNLFSAHDSAAGSGCLLTIQGVDLSFVGSGKNLVRADLSGSGGLYNFIDCKLNASVAIQNAPASAGIRTNIIRCDSGATNYRVEAYDFAGTQTTELTIVRTSPPGATDNTTPISWKIVTTANSSWLFPFKCIPISIWNNVSDGSTITVVVEGIWGGGAVPNNDDIWLEVEYMGSSATPQGTFSINTKANYLATGTAQSSSTSTWGGSTTPFKMTASIVPLLKGPLNIMIKVAKPSSTFYINPVAEGPNGIGLPN